MKGKICLVTGGAEGIGKATSQELLKNGAKVIICDNNKFLGNETANEFREKYGEDHIEFFICDVSDSLQFEDCFRKAVERFGGLDVVVNNAGICTENDDWKKVIDINLGGAICGTKLAFKYMSKKEGGSGGTVVNIGSIGALDPYPFLPVYTATKSAINQFTRSIGADVVFSESGVKVISINPGKTITRILDTLTFLPPVIVELTESLPGQTPEHVGKCLVKLIESAPSGSLWIIEIGEKPIQTIVK